MFFRTPLDQLRNELNKLDSQINKIQNQMKAPNTHPDVREQMSEFLPVRFFPTKALVTLDILTHNTVIKRNCNKKIILSHGFLLGYVSS